MICWTRHRSYASVVALLLISLATANTAQGSVDIAKFAKFDRFIHGEQAAALKKTGYPQIEGLRPLSLYETRAVQCFVARQEKVPLASLPAVTFEAHPQSIGSNLREGLYTVTIRYLGQRQKGVPVAAADGVQSGPKTVVGLHDRDHQDIVVGQRGSIASSLVHEYSEALHSAHIRVSVTPQQRKQAFVRLLDQLVERQVPLYGGDLVKNSALDRFVLANHSALGAYRTGASVFLAQRQAELVDIRGTLPPHVQRAMAERGEKTPLSAEQIAVEDLFFMYSHLTYDDETHRVEDDGRFFYAFEPREVLTRLSDQSLARDLLVITEEISRELGHPLPSRWRRLRDDMNLGNELAISGASLLEGFVLDGEPFPHDVLLDIGLGLSDIVDADEPLTEMWLYAMNASEQRRELRRDAQERAHRPDADVTARMLIEGFDYIDQLDARSKALSDWRAERAPNPSAE